MHVNRRSRILLLAVAVCAAVGLGQTTAVAAQTPPTAGWITIHVAATGKTLRLPTNWQSLAPQQLAKYGLVPNMPAPDSAQSSLVKADAAATAQGGGGAIAAESTVSPLSASGWSGNVFIGLTGSGLHLDQRYTQTAVISSPICTYAAFWLSYTVLWRTGAEYCSEDAVYYYYYNNITFTSNVHVCNTWVGISGKPCEYVHS